MEKIAIIGSSGAGKSTLARKLGSLLNIKVFHLDRFFWQRDWKKKSRESRIDILQNIGRERRWIIEGNYLGSSELLIDMADAIIFLDVPPLLCLQRIVKRHHKYQGLSRRDIPTGCQYNLNLVRMLNVLNFPLQDRRRLIENLYKCSTSKPVIRFRSKKEVVDFLARLEPHTYEER